MTITTITIPMNSAYGDRPWTARITGRDPKYKFGREFCAAIVTEPGVYAGSTREKKATGVQYYAVTRNDAGDLVRTGIGDETLALLVDGWLDRMDAIRPVWSEEKQMWNVKRDGKIIERHSDDTLRAERERLVARLAEIDAELAVQPN